MTPAPDHTDDVETLRAALAAEREARLAAEARATGAEARAVGAEAMITHLKLVIAKLRHDKFGASSERGRKLLDQLELELGELVATEAEDATRAEEQARTRPGAPPPRRPSRGPLPAHLPRERVVLPSPAACPCCGGKLSKLGEDVTETLEVVPRQWKVIQTVREKFSCRACDRITQPPAPFHPIARGRAGPNLLAMVLEAKFGQHLPLNRQSESYAREGVELSVSTLADWVGTAAAVLSPLHALIEAHVLAAERLHGDDTTVPLLARGKTVTARLWTYVRDDQPFAGPAPPAAVFYFSRDRTAEHPKRHLASYTGILQADAYAGFGDLYLPGRKPGAITEAACWAHFRRKVFELAEVARAPLAAEAVRRIDQVFEAERAVNRCPAADRLTHRQSVVAPLVADLRAWMLETRGRLSRHNDLAKALDYALKRWAAFTQFLSDGRVCLTNNAAERALRGVALGRKAWLFAGSDRGGERAAMIYALITTAKLNSVDPRAWLADVLARIADHPASRLDELLPWKWQRSQAPATAAA
ncbi:IS66 family transposase [Pseudoroseomonas wenyumeiae]|uniref:IS66 family transposase n=1 Tax=Teichococcus wenyumeiae TaxID=2478470 RepID=A0A3A9JBG1_9PROT|nr:IS66 family transposase [Pseudoroseomonas wenyumeiae]RKK03822.1 IS66 family transposase [Pseudoroseomonas wenyumeiae]RMI16904.1 IS66 family transposase [Pseudoroseomonas wenyumeiae]